MSVHSSVVEIELIAAVEAEATTLHAAAAAALAAVSIDDGHVAIAFVDQEEMRGLNRRHRSIDSPTDVLSFPVDGTDAVAGPRELGDVVICREHTEDVPEAVIHGVLHLCGFDHESDEGEMLALQDSVVAQLATR